MKKRTKWLVGFLIGLLLISAAIYIAGQLGYLRESVMMLSLFPFMLAILCPTCVIYAEGAADEKRDR